MPNPTRPQIEATYALPKYKVEIYSPVNTWIQLTNAKVFGLEDTIDSTGNISNGVAFGSPSEPSATIEIEDYEIYTGYFAKDKRWINHRIRISFSFDTADFIQLFIGLVSGIKKSGPFVTYNAVGLQQYLADIKIHSPIYYHKLAATKTTVSSIEDPSIGGYSAGLINYAFWQAGGRPKEQEGINYTEASAGFNFWYSCDFSILAPEFSWFSGDNTLDELYTLARAGGGQIYQDAHGTMRYTQPLSLADTTGYAGIYFTFTDAMFESYEETINNAEQIGTLKLTYTPRRLAPEQVIIEDTESRFIRPSETKTIELSAQLPIWYYIGLISGNNQTAINTMQAFLTTGDGVIPTIGTVLQYANKVSITLTNPNASYPMVIESIKIKGRPLAAGEDANASLGSVAPERVLENNVNIQTDSHAERYLKMIYDFYVDNKPMITLSNVMFDPDRYVGELVKLNCMYNSSADIYRIVRLSHTNGGTSMSVSLVNVTGIPERSQMFIVGTSYSDGTTKKVSY